MGLSVGDLEGVKVGSFDRGAMVGDPSGKAGQNVGHALEVSACIVVVMIFDVEKKQYDI